MLYDIGATVTVDSESHAALVSGSSEAEKKVVRVTGADGREYLLAANFGSAEADLTLPDEAVGADVLSGPQPVSTKGGLTVQLMPGGAALLRLSQQLEAVTIQVV